VPILINKLNVNGKSNKIIWPKQRQQINSIEKKEKNATYKGKQQKIKRWQKEKIREDTNNK